MSGTDVSTPRVVAREDEYLQRFGAEDMARALVAVIAQMTAENAMQS